MDLYAGNDEGGQRNVGIDGVVHAFDLHIGAGALHAWAEPDGSLPIIYAPHTASKPPHLRVVIRIPD